MRVHFIAIGGSAMHNLAIALKQQGCEVSGSDDHIFEPSRSRLMKYDLYPAKEGWYPARITKNIDTVIVGMHARANNPELMKACELGLNIYSYPEFLYHQTKNKTRIVIGGSHGKTTITSIILHVLYNLGIDADYMVGAQLEGFEVMVRLTGNAPVAVLEGDEYPSSPADPRPKFHHYRPHIALISGIAWDHVNVFPTFENYLDQFVKFLDVIENDGKLIYFAEDEITKKVCEEYDGKSFTRIPYETPKYENDSAGVNYLFNGIKYRVGLFGKHNLQNINAAHLVCSQLGIPPEDFFRVVAGFSGASNRLEKIAENNSTVIYKDFAHAPSKLRATIGAIKEQYPRKKVIACMELHTYSSLSGSYLSQYKNTMNEADIGLVYYDPQTVLKKELSPITPRDIKHGFDNNDLIVYSDINRLINRLKEENLNNSCIVFMSSGSFNRTDLNKTADELLNRVCP